MFFRRRPLRIRSCEKGGRKLLALRGLVDPKAVSLRTGVNGVNASIGYGQATEMSLGVYGNIAIVKGLTSLGVQSIYDWGQPAFPQWSAI